MNEAIKYLMSKGWKSGGSPEMMSGGNWYDPVTGQLYWNIREPLQIQANRDADALLIILANCEPSKALRLREALNRS